MLFRLLPWVQASATVTSVTLPENGAQLMGDVLTLQGVQVYRGIRYARAERWRAPQPFQYDVGVHSMHEHGHQCPQMSKNQGKWQVTMIENPAVPQSEDCLNLVIYCPSKPTSLPKPVMIYLHGGNFVTGSNAMPLQDYSKLAQSQDLIVVVPNYRLGVLGFTLDPTLPPSEPNGNWGLMDAELAAQWVQRNIAAFGGDPHRVTLAGHSAGAMMAHLLTAAGRLHWQQLLLGSGTVSTKPAKSRVEAEQEVATVTKLLGANAALGPVERMAWLRLWDPVRLSMALYEEGGNRVYTPITDGVYVTADPHQLGQSRLLPNLLTWTRDDASFFVPRDLLKDETEASYLRVLHSLFPTVADGLIKLYPFKGKASSTLSEMLTDMIFRKPALHWARRHASHVYEFEEGAVNYFEEPLGGIGEGNVVFHNSEIPLLNGTYDRFKCQGTVHEVCQRWMRAVGDFVRHGTSFGQSPDPADEREALWIGNPWPVNLQLAGLRYMQ